MRGPDYEGLQQGLEANQEKFQVFVAHGFWLVSVVLFSVVKADCWLEQVPPADERIEQGLKYTKGKGVRFRSCTLHFPEIRAISVILCFCLLSGELPVKTCGAD